MQVDHDITAELDNPHLSGVKVVAAIRRISVAQARVELLTEWDQRLESAIVAELNAYTPVSVLGEFSLEAVKRFTVVVMTQGSTEEQLKLNDFTHANGIKFIAAETAGLFGSAFCDFGEQFPVVDQTGENPLSGMVVEIEEAEDALVTCLDETRHGLEDGDYVRFSEVEGMDINSDGVEGARKVTVVGKYPFFPASSLADQQADI